MMGPSLMSSSTVIHNHARCSPPGVQRVGKRSKTSSVLSFLTDFHYDGKGRKAGRHDWVHPVGSPNRKVALAAA